MSFSAREVNRCNLGHLNAAGATVCGWCGAPIANPTVQSASGVEYRTGWWPAGLTSVACFLLIGGMLSPLLTFDIFGEEMSSIGYFGASFANAKALQALWPGRIAPGVFLLLLLIPVLILAGFLLTRQKISRQAIIGIAAAHWGLAAALFIINIADYRIVESRFAESSDSALLNGFIGFSPNPGAGFVFILGSSLFLAATGFVLIFASQGD